DDASGRLRLHSADEQDGDDHRHELVGRARREGRRGLGQPRRYGPAPATRRDPVAGRRVTMGEIQERNKQIVLREYEEVWNQGRMETADEVVDPNFTDHPPTRFF